MRDKIEAYIFKKTMRGYEFLLLKRNNEHDGIWQPVTGKAEKGEEAIETAKREIEEETGLKDFIKIIDLEYCFQFKNKHGEFKEACFGFGVSPQTEEIKISYEHQNYCWVNFETAYELLYWDSNKEVLKLLNNKLTQGI